MLNKSYIFAAAVILGINYSAFAAISESDKAVFKKHAELCKAQNQFNLESSRIFSNYRYQLEKYVSTLKALKSGKSSDINRSIKNLERQKKYAEHSTKSYKNTLKRLEKSIDSIKTDKVKQAEVDKIYSECNKLKAQIDKIIRPYNQRRAKYMAKIDANVEKSKLKALITPLIKQVPGLVSKVQLYIYYNSFQVSCYFDKQNKRLAHANISIKPIKRPVKKEKLAGKYPIYYNFKNNIYFNVGDFQISFHVHDKSMQSKTKVKELAQKLIDLAGLKKVSNRQVVQKWLTASKFFQKLDKQSAAATGKLSSKRSKLMFKMHKLSREGFKSSAEIKRLNAAYLHAKSGDKNNKETISSANFLLKQLKTPAAKRESAIQAIEKKTADLKNEIFSYCATVNKKKALLSKDINFPETNRQYQILTRKFVKLSKNKTFIMPNRKIVDAWLGTPQIRCRWEQDLSTGQHPSVRSVFAGKISYRPDYILSNSKGMMDNKYPIISNDYTFTIRVGDFNVSIYSAATNFYAHDINKKAIKEFYDLDAIANIAK